MTNDLRSRVAEFLYHEAHLLDERRFDEWLELYTDDAYYWAPVLPTAQSRKTEPSIFDEDKIEMVIRVRRMNAPSAHTEKPPARACREVACVVVEQRSDSELLVRSKLAVYEHRLREYARDEEREFHATVRHRLVSHGDTFKIAWKRVDLITSAAAVPMMPSPL